ncbi:hypothetical protein EC968_001165, partial [Mortierella alpina]
MSLRQPQQESLSRRHIGHVTAGGGVMTGMELSENTFQRFLGPKENEYQIWIVNKRKHGVHGSGQEDRTSAVDYHDLGEVVNGLIKDANESVYHPIGALTEAKRHDAFEHIPTVFGAVEVSVPARLPVHWASPVFLPKPMSQYKTLPRDRGKCKINSSSHNNGINYILQILKPEFKDNWNFANASVDKFEYAFSLPDRKLLVYDIRVSGIGKPAQSSALSIHEQLSNKSL